MQAKVTEVHRFSLATLWSNHRHSILINAIMFGSSNTTKHTKIYNNILLFFLIIQ